MTITVYRFENAQGCEQQWTTQNPTEAKEHAEKYGYKCFAMEFEYSDEEVVWDFTVVQCERCGNKGAEERDGGEVLCVDCDMERLARESS